MTNKLTTLPPPEIFRGCRTDDQRCIEFMRWRGLSGAVSEDFEFNVPGKKGKLMSHQTGTGAWNRLWKKGTIVPTGEIRMTRLGNPAKVHVLNIYAKRVKPQGFQFNTIQP